MLAKHDYGIPHFQEAMEAYLEEYRVLIEFKKLGSASGKITDLNKKTLTIGAAKKAMVVNHEDILSIRKA